MAYVLHNIGIWSKDPFPFLFQPRKIGATAMCHAAFLWCEAEFGPLPESAIGARWWTNGFSVWLMNEDDALHFKIRWG